MNTLLYLVARVLIGCIQCLPLRLVALLGRLGGTLGWIIDRRHRNAAVENIQASFPDRTATEVLAIAKENFKRIGENYACAVKTASMTDEQVRKVLGGVHVDRYLDNETRSWVAAVGHFGNFELYARSHLFIPDIHSATTYRGLRQPALDKLLLHLRRQSGGDFFERRKEGSLLKERMRDGKVILGLLADQHAGNRGEWLPFLGRECSTSAAPAVFALRYDCPLHTAICYRVGLARWEIEFGEEIPTKSDGKPRPITEICRDMNAALEEAIRRDPANWFWVHRRWKNPSKFQIERAKQIAKGEAVEETDNTQE
ncbi:MAG: lysophospholipid acyltransferase family protein [Limisphaerales bacterium]